MTKPTVIVAKWTEELRRIWLKKPQQWSDKPKALSSLIQRQPQKKDNMHTKNMWYSTLS